MKAILINQILLPVVAAGIGTVLEIGRRQLKFYLNSKKELIDKQKEALKQSMGIEQYNKDVTVVKDAVKTIEQLAKEFNWSGELKHSKVLDLIKGETSLNDEEIFNIIKAAVLEVNKFK